MKRYGPSRRRAEDASAALTIFVRHPKKTFATISAKSGHSPKKQVARISLSQIGIRGHIHVGADEG
jgi:hypothetical protein